MIDLLVAGGGPVGLGTALYATRRGLRVAVAEPRPAPIDKACGEGLMPGAVAALRELGVDPPGRSFAGIRYVRGQDHAEGFFRSGPGLGVRRTELHASLAGAAEDAGIEVIPAAVHGIEQTDRYVEAALSGRAGSRGAGARRDAGSPNVRTRYLAAADGLHSPIRDRLGLALPPPRPRRYGLRQHFRVRPWSECVEVHWAAGAEAYVTPVGGELVGVAVLFKGRAPYDRWLAEFPLLAERLADADPASPVRGAGPLWQRARRRVAGRVLLVGDAAGYVDALTGEGVRVGLAAGAELADCLAAGRPDDYERRWRRATREYRLLSGALVRASQRPWLRSGIVPAAAALPGVFGGAINLLAGRDGGA